MSESSNMPSLEIGIDGLSCINGQLNLIVKPPFLLVPKTAKVQFGLTPKCEMLLFTIAETIFLLYNAFLIMLRI